MDALAAYGSSSSDDAPPPPPRPAPHSFPVHVKIPAPIPPPVAAALAAWAAVLAAAVPGFTPDPRLTAAAGGEDGCELHVSLSRGAALPSLAAAAALLDALRDVLTGAARFTLRLEGGTVLLSDPGGRAFACVGAAASPPASSPYTALVRAADDAATLSDLPPFHAAPLPHVSVGSADAGAVDAAALAAAMAAAPPPPVVEVDVARVVCRVGNRTHVVWRAEG